MAEYKVESFSDVQFVLDRLFKQLQESSTAGAFTGQIVVSGGPTAPPNTLACDGTIYFRSAYPPLFAEIGTAWNYGTVAADSFRVPNLHQRFLLGVGADVGLVARVLGEYGGEERHTLTTSEMPVHTHPQLPHGHGMNVGPSGLGVDAVVPASSPTGSGGGIVPTTAVNQNAGGGDPHNNQPPFAAVNFFIRI